MTLNAITLLFKEARDAFPPLDGKPTDSDLLSIRETLLSILMEVPYNQLGVGMVLILAGSVCNVWEFVPVQTYHA